MNDFIRSVRLIDTILHDRTLHGRHKWLCRHGNKNMGSKIYKVLFVFVILQYVV